MTMSLTHRASSAAAARPPDGRTRRLRAAAALLTLLAAGCQLAPRPAPPQATAAAGVDAAAPQAVGATAGIAADVAAAAATAQARALSSAGFAVDGDGWALSLDSRVLFDFDSDALSPQARADIARLAHVLLQAGITHLSVEGHSDNLGSAEINQRLSLRRAESVAREFAANGLSRANIAAVGHGMTRPIADNRSEAGRAQNRRVVVIIPAG